MERAGGAPQIGHDGWSFQCDGSSELRHEAMKMKMKMKMRMRMRIRLRG
jgi:hypothetical protein